MLSQLKKVAMVFKERQVEYSELLSRAVEWAKQFPIEEEERCIIFAENSMEWVFAFYSIWFQRGIAVPVDHMASVDDLAYIIKDCTPRRIWTSKKNYEQATEALKQSGLSLPILVFEEIEQVPKEQLHAEKFPDIDDESTALFIYTSGTTGNPKGVMLSYRNLKANIDSVFEAGYFQPEDRTLVLLPTHHILPLMGTIIAPLYTGGSIAFAPSLQGEDIISTLQTNKITLMIGVPRLYSVIAKGIYAKINASFAAKMLYKLCGLVKSRALSKLIFKKVHQHLGGSIRGLVCGGAPLSEPVARIFETLGFYVYVGYGMSETAPIITFPRVGKTKLNASGQILPGIEVKIDEGEICVRGQNVMKGYWNRPEETAAVIVDGWLHTGDLGYFDEDGFLFVTGRKKEIIVLPNGKNINPEEIEQKILGKTSLIAEIGVYMDEDILQCVVVPDFAQIRAQGVLNFEEHLRWEIIAKYNLETSPYKKITKFTVVKDELPKTRLGKLRRFALADAAKAVRPEEKKKKQTDFVEFEEYNVIKEFIEEKIEREVFPDDHLEIDLAMDSLDKIALQTFINESYGLQFSETDLIEFSSIKLLAEQVRENKSKAEIHSIDWEQILREDISGEKMPTRWVTQGLFRWFGQIALKLGFKYRAQGRENIPEGPCIIAPNHQSFIDGLIVAGAMSHTQFSQCYFFAKAKHIQNKMVRMLAERHNVIVSDINKDLKLSIQKIAEALRNGKKVIIFPEGTRTRDGHVGRFKDMFAIISRELDVPIVPVVIDGAYDVLPLGQKMPRFGKEISIKILPPIQPEKMEYSELCQKVRDVIVAEQSN